MNQYIENLLNQVPGLSPEEKHELASQLPVKEFEKGTILLQQGNVCTHCYHVFSGLVRQYFIDEEGNEKSVAFYCEGQTAALLDAESLDTVSRFFWKCEEDSVLLAGDLRSESDVLSRFPALQNLIRDMLQKALSTSQNTFASFVSSSPEERYQHLLNTRPDLFKRVPQHQNASFLGISPESLSRIKKRLSSSSSLP